MSLLHSVHVIDRAQLAAAAPRKPERNATGARSCRGRGPPSASSSRAQRIDLGLRETRAHALAELARRRRRRGRARRVRAQAIRGLLDDGARAARSWPTTSSPPPRSTRVMPRRMIGSRFPSRTRGAGLIAVHAQPSPVRGAARPEAAGQPFGQTALPIRSARASLRLGLGRRRASSSAPGRAPRAPPSASSPSGRARGDACSSPGGSAVEAEAARRASVTASCPVSGSVTQTSATRLAVAVGDGAADAVHLEQRRARGPSVEAARDRLRPHLGAALERAPDSHDERRRRSRATPCTARRPRSRSRTRPRRRSCADARLRSGSAASRSRARPSSTSARQRRVGVEDRQHLREQAVLVLDGARPRRHGVGRVDPQRRADLERPAVALHPLAPSRSAAAPSPRAGRRGRG